MSNPQTEKPRLSEDDSAFSAHSKDIEKAAQESEIPGDDESTIENPPNFATGSAAVNPWDPSQFPDGGVKAWLVVAGAFCCFFCSFGWINCIGVFQDYYQTTVLKDYTASDISWIGSLELFIMLAGGLIIGRVYDLFGPRYILLSGTFFHVFGLMMASLSTTYYQLLLSQGICSPIGICCLFTPATNCVISWFAKRRAFALGITAAGSGLGGVLLPIMVNRLIASVGFGWAMRSVAFLLLGLLIFANLTVRSRMPPRPRPLKLSQFLTPLTEKHFVLLTVACSIFYLGLFLPINYIQLQAISYGMSPSLALYLIPLLNVGSIIGRVIPTFIADKVGRNNTNIVMAFLGAILSLALWLPATGNAPLIVFALFYGVASGAFVALIPALVAQISDISEIGHRTGLCFGILSIPALVSNPIGGAIITADHGGFRNLQIYAGVILLAGACLFVVVRFILSRKLWEKI